jgi:exodeoxyribonuclease-5
MTFTAIKIDTPTKHQQEGIDFINDFILSNAKTAVLKGYAGTGKTTLLKYFLNTYKGNCCVTAPIHKAVRVLESTLGKKGKTVHSLLGLRLNVDLDNFDISSPQFDPLGQEYIMHYNLIIIDESSTINSPLYDLLCLKSSQYNVKLLFIGDPCQLPPVREIVSKAFLISNSFELTEIIRQKDGNPLLDLLELCRQDILTKSNDFYPYLIKTRRNIVNHEGYILLNSNDFKGAILNYYKHDNFSKDVDFIRTVAWTNWCVEGWNKFIRNSIFDNPFEILHDKDLLTSYGTIVDDFNSPIIVNSEDYRISMLRTCTDADKVVTYNINLTNVHGNFETPPLKVINIRNEVGFIKFYQQLCALHYRATNSNSTTRRTNWRNYYAFKNSHLIMKGFNLSNNNDKAFVKKDLDYGYALTVHKSQGSTYNNIAIDLEDIMYNTSVNAPDKSLRDRLIYVALSRAKNIAIIKL